MGLAAEGHCIQAGARAAALLPPSKMSHRFVKMKISVRGLRATHNHGSRQMRLAFVSKLLWASLPVDIFAMHSCIAGELVTLFLKTALEKQ